MRPIWTVRMPLFSVSKQSACDPTPVSELDRFVTVHPEVEMKTLQQILKDLFVRLFGEPILKPVYAGLAVAGVTVVFVKFVIVVIASFTDIEISGEWTGPLFWQVFVAVLLAVSHAQQDESKLDLGTARYWISLIFETLAIIASLVCVGLIYFYNRELFPFTFWGLSVMLFMIIIRRLDTDSIVPSIQILRFVSACWFWVVGTWMYLPGNEMNVKIRIFSLALLIFYFILVIWRKQGLTEGTSTDS